jgi:hypothetical protein
MGGLTALSLLVTLAAGSGRQDACRQPALDSLARAVWTLGAIPEGPRLVILSAVCGWPGRTGSVTFVDTGTPEVTGGMDEPWGSWMDDTGGGVLVEAPWPACMPSGLPVASEPGLEIAFTLISDRPVSELQVSWSSPGDSVGLLTPDSSGCFRLEPSGEGVWWIEAVRVTPGDREVMLLLPVLCGITLQEALHGCDGVRSPGISTIEEMLAAMDSIRGLHGLPPLCRSPILDSLARVRATGLALDGSVSHAGSGIDGIPDSFGMRAENIGRGGSFMEAFSMILTSPAHLAACCSPAYTATGAAAALGALPGGWQIVIVQLFSEGGVQE